MAQRKSSECDPHANQVEDNLSLAFLINEEKVRFQMAFSLAVIISRKGVILMLWIEFLTFTEQIGDFKKQVNVLSLFPR